MDLGFPPEKIVFDSPVKTEPELSMTTIEYYLKDWPVILLIDMRPLQRGFTLYVVALKICIVCIEINFIMNCGWNSSAEMIPASGL